MSKKVKSSEKEIFRIKAEIDVPNEKFSQNQREEKNNFSLARALERKINKETYNTIKGHNLLGWCVGLLILIYFIETFFHGGKTSGVASSIVEILKLLMFSLTGYLFGKDSNDSSK